MSGNMRPSKKPKTQLNGKGSPYIYNCRNDISNTDEVLEILHLLYLKFI